MIYTIKHNPPEKRKLIETIVSGDNVYVKVNTDSEDILSKIWKYIENFFIGGEK